MSTQTFSEPWPGEPIYLLRRDGDDKATLIEVSVDNDVFDPRKEYADTNVTRLPIWIHGRRNPDDGPGHESREAFLAQVVLECGSMYQVLDAADRAGVVTLGDPGTEEAAHGTCVTYNDDARTSLLLVDGDVMASWPMTGSGHRAFDLLADSDVAALDIAAALSETEGVERALRKLCVLEPVIREPYDGGYRIGDPDEADPDGYAYVSRDTIAREWNSGTWQEAMSRARSAASWEVAAYSDWELGRQLETREFDLRGEDLEQGNDWIGCTFEDVLSDVNPGADLVQLGEPGDLLDASDAIDLLEGLESRCPRNPLAAMRIYQGELDCGCVRQAWASGTARISNDPYGGSGLALTVLDPSKPLGERDTQVPFLPDVPSVEEAVNLCTTDEMLQAATEAVNDVYHTDRDGYLALASAITGEALPRDGSVKDCLDDLFDAARAERGIPSRDHEPER